ncbi:DUF411 domain-containing protein [Filomicrobium sp.]|uniref:DUF411 domain-containing protein n=1 Tax=Filomicrobium sp. TaxID=2024831 RepID=UPI00258FCF15|nr:DUF411 domain-containing protein [Filomicrobium sp.]
MFFRAPVLVAIMGLVWGGVALAAETQAPPLQVFKSATCSCCSAWIKHMTQHGFTAEAQDVAAGELARIKQSAGIGPQHASCHTAKIGGYSIEGHVPAADVKRLLAEKPDAVGLAVPGMPIGSPGMEAGDTREPYEVLLIKHDGTSEVWSKQNQ